MKKGAAMEGFIREDGTVRPIEHYDDTELRGKIQTNTDNISNLDSRVTELEEHGGVEDPTKADKVENATAGNLASLDADGNLQDSGKKPADFALADHEHNHIADFSGENHCGASVSVGEGDQGAGVISLLVKGDGQGSASKTVEIGYYEAENLQRALEDPVKSYDPDSAYSDNKLITAAAVKAALAHLPMIHDYLLDNGQYKSLGVDIDKAYDAVVKFPASDQCDILVRSVVTGDEKPDNSQLSATVELVWGSNLYSFQRESLSQLRSLIRTAVLATGVTASAYDDATYGAKYFQLFYKVVIDSTSAQSGGYLEFELYNS